MAPTLVHQRKCWNGLKVMVHHRLAKVQASLGNQLPESIIGALSAIDLHAPDASTADFDPSAFSKLQLTENLIEIRTLWKTWYALAEELRKVGLPLEQSEGINEA